jgi:hypothetical protein
MDIRHNHNVLASRTFPRLLYTLHYSDATVPSYHAVYTNGSLATFDCGYTDSPLLPVILAMSNPLCS